MPWVQQPPDPDNPGVKLSEWKPAEGEPEHPPPARDVDGLIIMDQVEGLVTWECRRCPDLGILNLSAGSQHVLMRHVAWHKLPWWLRLITQRPKM